MAPILKTECLSLEAFSDQLQHLHLNGFVNARHHYPNRLSAKEYLICTRERCKRCSTTSGLSIVWRSGSDARFPS